jgi:hypothetical protein
MKMSALSYEDAVNCVLFGTEWFADFRSKYGHLILVFQELEQELKSTVDYMKMCCEKLEIDEEFESEPKNSTFEVMIRMFASQLDQSKGSRDLVSRLHKARKYRNRLAHDFTSAESLGDHLSAGGRARTIDQLDARINHVIPLVMIVYRIGRAYASDVGKTDQFIEEQVNRMCEQLDLQTTDEIVTYMTGEFREDKGGGDSVIALEDL